MRPYMLWLAVAYSGSRSALDHFQVSGPNALGDWIKYQSERRFEVEAWRA